MKMSDFTQVLRKIIKEEVRSVVREELKSALTPILLEQKTTISQRQNRNPLPLPKQGIQKDYGTKMGNTLSDLLRETANDLRNGTSAPIQESTSNDWSDMGHYDAEEAPGFGMMQGFNENSTSVNSNDPTSAFIKDYSEVLKSSYEHSGLK